MDMQVDAGRRTNDEMFKAGASLAQKDVPVVRLYGVSRDGACECSKGRDCPNPGKHPVGFNWQHHATTDENVIESWFADEPEVTPNLGVILGERSGIIDVEGDTPEAEAASKKWGLDQIDTPAFRSPRGIHRLFAREPGLPDVAVVKVDGIEVRLGGGGKAAQTVLPPSWHADGFAREWLPGRSPEECELQPLPRAFRDAVIAAAGAKTGGGVARNARAATAVGRVFHEGEGRHEYLHGEALSLASSTRDLQSQAILDRIHTIVLSLNQTQCKPPYPDHEVRRCTNDAIAFIRARRAEEDRPWEKMGLERNAERPREYEPGSWRLTIFHGDPVEYVIAGVMSPTGGSMSVHLTTDEFMCPSKAAKKILATTTDVDPTNPTSEAWARLWKGYSLQDGEGNRREVKGLKAKLLGACEHEHPPAEYKRHALLAAWLLDYLRRFKKPVSDEATEPSPTGSPKWLNHGGRVVLAFRYEDAWSKAAEQAGGHVTSGETREMSRRIRKITGEKNFEPMSRRGKDGAPGFRFTVWGDTHIVALEQLSGVETAQRQ